MIAMLQNNMVKLVLLSLVLSRNISNATDLSKKQVCQITTFKDNSSNSRFVFFRQWQDRDYQSSLWICSGDQRIELDKNIQAEIFCNNVSLTLGLFCNRTLKENQVTFPRNATIPFFNALLKIYSFFKIFAPVIMVYIIYLNLISHDVWKLCRKIYKAPRTHCPRCGGFCESVCSYFTCYFEDENDDTLGTCQDLLPFKKDRDQEGYAYFPNVNSDQVIFDRFEERSGDSNDSSVNVAASSFPKLLPNCVECDQKSGNSSYVFKDNSEVESDLTSTSNVRCLGDGFEISKDFDNQNKDTELLTHSSGGSSQDLLDSQNIADYTSAFSSYAVPEFRLDQSRHSLKPVPDQVCGVITSTLTSRNNFFKDNNTASSFYTRVLLHGDETLCNQDFAEEHSSAASVVDAELSLLSHTHKPPGNQYISKVKSLNSLFTVSAPLYGENDNFLVKHQYNGVNNTSATFQRSLCNLVGAEYSKETTDYRNLSYNDETGFWNNRLYQNNGNGQTFFRSQNNGGSAAPSSTYVHNVCATQAFATEDKNKTSSFQVQDARQRRSVLQENLTDAFNSTNMPISVENHEESQKVIKSQRSLRELNSSNEEDTRSTSSDISDYSFPTASYSSAAHSSQNGSIDSREGFDSDSNNSEGNNDSGVDNSSVEIDALV